MEAYRAGQISKSAVPEVFLHATEESALNGVNLKDLKEFAAEGEASNSGTRPIDPSGRPSAGIREV